MLIKDAMKEGGPDDMQDQGSNGAGQPVDNAQPDTEEPSVGIGQEQATEEEQQAYERVVLAGIKILSDESTNPAIMQMLQQGAADPAQAIAGVASTIILQLDDMSGGQIPEEVILPAATEILENVVEFAMESEVLPVDESVQGRAAQIMLTTLGDEYGVSEEDIQELMAGMSLEEMQGHAQSQMDMASATAAQPAAQPEMQSQQPPLSSGV